MKCQHLRNDLDQKSTAAQTASEEYNRAKRCYERDNVRTIARFNEVYGVLLRKSSYGLSDITLDDSYMPNTPFYREKSAVVPIRLLYYLTILTLALENSSVKHPKFLLIDTLENSGIDKENLQKNLLLLFEALKVAAEKNIAFGKYQIILTIGHDRIPIEFETYVKDSFNKSEGLFILKESQIN